MYWADGQPQLSRISALLRPEGKERGGTVLGPAPAPLPLLRGRRRFQCLFKAGDWQAIRALYAALLPLAYLAAHTATWRKMVRIDHGEELNVCLGETARNILLFGALFTAGILLG